MKYSDMETNLLGHGFTKKEILYMRKLIERDNLTYSSLLTGLKNLFIAMFVVLVIIFSGLLYTIYHDEKDDVVSYFITLMIVLPLILYFAPMKLGYKAFRYNMRR
jgi:tryptophan-rich sensory protein